VPTASRAIMASGPEEASADERREFISMITR
jgi:hypothetical protein